MILQTRKIQEYFAFDSFQKTEVGNIHWFFYEDMIPLSEIYKEREIFCDKMDWDINAAEDTYSGQIGAVYWWNAKMLDYIRSWLWDLYPRESKGFSKVRDILNHMEDTQIKKEKKYGSAEERERFYDSLDWSYVKYLRYFIDRGICQRCGIEPIIPEMNHLYPITSEQYPELFIRNLDITRIETLCAKCHKEFHDMRTNNDTHFDYK